jgi:hypothetical protein
MWSSDEFAAIEHSFTLDDIPPTLRALIPDEDLDAMAESGELDRGMALHLVYEQVFELPEPETVEWVMTAVQANPGKFWISQLCRAMHGLPENFKSITWCGLCQEYANPRKRERSNNLPRQTLPSLEETGGAFQLHPPCSKRGLTWLRKLVYRLADRGKVKKIREFRPDICQARGYDLMSVLYQGESGRGKDVAEAR